MSALVLVSGNLFRKPEQRTAKTGKAFVTATIKCRDGAETSWWKICAFSESACAELMRLDDGDGLSVQGRLEIAQYEQDGATRLRLSCIADHVLAVRPPPRESKAKAETKPRSDRPRRDRSAVDPDLNDQVPF